MKAIAYLILLLCVTSAHGLTLEEIKNNQDNLFFKNSKGPKNIQVLKDHAMEKMEGEEDFYKSIEDGINHDAADNCEDHNDVLNKVFRIDDVEASDDWPTYDFEISSIKKTKTGSSIAYILNPTIHFGFIFYVYKTKASWEKGDRTELLLNCPVNSGWDFVYKKNKGKTAEYLGLL